MTRRWLAAACARLAAAFGSLAVLLAAASGPGDAGGERPDTHGPGGTGPEQPGDTDTDDEDEEVDEDQLVPDLEVTQEERVTHEELAVLRQTAYAQARTAADRWGAAAAGVFTALGLTALLQGGQRIRALTQPYEEAAAAATVVSFALALVAVVWAMVVAHRLSPAELGAQTAPEEVRDRPKRANAVLKALRRSQLMVTVAVTLVIATFVALLFAPPDKRQTRVMAVGSDGELVCGTLDVRNGENGILTSDKDFVEQVAADSLTPVASCRPMTP